MPFAIFHEAIRNFFRRARHGDEPVEVVFATPDRAYEEIERITLKRLKGALANKSPVAREILPAPTVQALSDRPTPTPFIALDVRPPRFDAARFSPTTFRGITKDLNNGTGLSMRFPRPIFINIQADLFCGQSGGQLIANHIQYQIDSQFLTDSAYLPVDWSLAKWYKPPFNAPEYARILGHTRARLVDGGWVDNTKIEFGQDSKNVRRTWIGRLEAYMPHRPVEARLVHKITLGIMDDTVDPAAQLDEIVIGGDE